MAYTRPWENVVLGSELARTIDDILTDKMTDIQERMDDIVEDWTADPVVLKSGIGGFVSKRATYIAGSSTVVAPYLDIKGILAFNFSVTTNGSGLVTFNLNEFNSASGGTHNWQSSSFEISGIIQGKRTDHVPVFGRVVSVNSSSNTFVVEFRYGDGVIVASLAISGFMTLYFTTAPITP